jgi:hypothetical protein
MVRQIEMDVYRPRVASKSTGTAISLAIHGVILFLVYAVGMEIVEEEKKRVPERTIEAVLIRTPPPTPRNPDAGSESGAGTPVDNKPKMARPKALARRAAVANVSRFNNVVQQPITRVAPTPVLGQQQIAKVNVEQIRRTQAPRNVTQTRVQTRVFSELGDVQPYSVATGPASSDAKLREAPTLNQTAGPRVQSAAGPVTQTNALAYEQPTIAEGVVGDYTVQGSPDGPAIRVMEPGSGSGYFDGVPGGQGAGSGGGDGNGTGGDGPGDGRGTGRGGSGTRGGTPGPRDCNADLQCRAYLEQIRQRVYGRWTPTDDVKGGGVQLSFRIDRSGAAHEIALVRSDNGALGDSCVTAFRHANPFPPPPASIAYLLEKKIIATFDFSRGGGG